MPELDLPPGDYRERKPKGWRWVALCFAVLPNVALAQFYDGNDLYDQCKSSTAAPYVMGQIDAFSWLTAGEDIAGNLVYLRRRFCVPDGVLGSQAADVVCKHLTDHPEIRHYPAAYLVTDALSLSWPCQP